VRKEIETNRRYLTMVVTMEATIGARSLQRWQACCRPAPSGGISMVWKAPEYTPGDNRSWEGWKRKAQSDQRSVFVGLQPPISSGDDRHHTCMPTGRINTSESSIVGTVHIRDGDGIGVSGG
jgi:hypothetical protein